MWEGGLQFEKDRSPGLIDVLQFGQDLGHPSEDRQLQACGCAVGPVYVGLGHLVLLSLFPPPIPAVREAFISESS